MKKYRINWSESVHYENVIEADTKAEAINEFNALPIEKLNVVGSRGGEDLEVYEIEE